MNCRVLAYLILSSVVVPLAPARGQIPEAPPGWRVGLDPPAADPEAQPSFVAMPPGWHVTAGAGAILWEPSMQAAGNFRIETETHRFAGRSADGHGVFLGGRDLDADSLQYLAFLVDRDGRYRIYHRAGADLHEFQPWTVHEAIATGSADPAAETARNVLAVEVGADSLRFQVNGRTVAAYGRGPYMQAEGQVGLRIHEGVEVHVTRLDVFGDEDGDGEAVGAGGGPDPSGGPQ